MDYQPLLQPVRSDAESTFRILPPHRVDNLLDTACAAASAGPKSAVVTLAWNGGRVGCQGEGAGVEEGGVFGGWSGLSDGYFGRDYSYGESFYS